MNGKETNFFKDVIPGEVIRLRIINGSASSYFNLQYAGGDMRIVSSDGINVQPLNVNKLEIAIAETYDILITVPKNGSAELRATSWDVVGYSSAFFGNGNEMKAPEIPKLNYFKMMREMNKMDMSKMNGKTMDEIKGMNMGNMNGMDMQKKDSSNKPMKMDNMDMGKMNMPSKDSAKKNTNNSNEMTGMNMGGMNMEMPAGTFSYDQI